MIVLVDYASPSMPDTTRDATSVSFATNLRRPVRFHGELPVDSRLIGRSVWNNEWILIIPGETLKGPTLADKLAGLETFLNTVSDVKLFFQTYSYPGN